MKLLIANWKASMTKSDAITWMTTFLNYIDSQNIDSKLAQKDTKIVICPPFPLIPFVQEQCEVYESIKIGAQTVSSAPQGAFTGEVTAELLKDYVSFAIIGHSERRKNFNETEEQIAKQIQNCINNNITPILCIRDAQDTVHENIKIVAFEPPDAIGGGKNASVEEVLAMKNQLNLNEGILFMYGASVDIGNISSYLETGKISGLLVGTASLHAESFIKLVEAMV